MPGFFGKHSGFRLVLTAVLTISGISIHAHQDGAYLNNSTPTHTYSDWMTALPDFLPLSELSIPGTHDSGAYGFGLETTETQSMTIGTQLAAGIRFLDLRVGQTPLCPLNLFHNFACQGTNLTWQKVVDELVLFLTNHPGETIVARVKKEYGDPSFDDVKAALGDHYYGARALETKTNPTLGELRGKIFVLHDGWGSGKAIGTKAWPSCAIDSIGAQTCQDHFSLSDNWDLANKWKSWVVPFFNKADNVRGADNDNRSSLYINHLSAAVGGFPYFFASGHSSWETSAPRLLTGMTRGLIDTCSGDANCLAEYPSVSCIDFFGVSGSETCSVAFEGINTLARNHILANVKDRVGIVIADFPGTSLIKSIIDLNPWRDDLVADAGGVNPLYIAPEGYGTIYLRPGANYVGTFPLETRWDTDGDEIYDTAYQPFDLYTSPVELTGKTDDYFGKVCIELKDEPSGVTDTDCTYVEFYNVQPTMEGLSFTPQVYEGQPARIQGAVLDPGLDSHSFKIDWDGNDAWDTQASFPVSATPCPAPLEIAYCKPFSFDFVYDDNGSYKLTVELRDDEGDGSDFISTIEVFNKRPEVNLARLVRTDNNENIVTNALIPAGTEVLATILFSDPGIADTHSAEISWGDGSLTDLPSVSGSFAQSHIFNLPGEKQIIVKVTDDDGAIDIHYYPVFFVQNPPPPPDNSPNANAGGPYSVVEGFFINADAGGSTVHPGRTAYYRWDFENDGTWDTARTTNPISPSWWGPDPDFPNDYSGQIKLEVWDGSQASTALASVEFTNTYPDVFARYSHQSIHEGETVELFIDIDDPGYDPHTVHIDWESDGVNDQTLMLPAGQKQAWASHTFANNPEGDGPDPGIEILTWITVIDDGGSTVYDQPNIDVHNVNPEAFITVISNGKGQVLGEPPFLIPTLTINDEVTLLGSWSDIGANDTVTVLIDWGDGSSTELPSPVDTFFEASHKYTTYGMKEVSITVTDDAGGEGSASWHPFEVVDWLFIDGFE